jgi:hypothetical protein
MYIHIHGYYLYAQDIEQHLTTAIQKCADISELDKMENVLSNLLSRIAEQKSLINFLDQNVIVVEYQQGFGFQVIEGKKSELEILGYPVKHRNIVESVECKRKNTKRYHAILNGLIKKYHPYKVEA